MHNPDIEQHFTESATVRDVVIGMSDGLTVPFALAAGLAGAVSNHWLVVIAGASEMAAGSIAMGLGGYLAARGDDGARNARPHASCLPPTGSLPPATPDPDPRSRGSPPPG